MPIVGGKCPDGVTKNFDSCLKCGKCMPKPLIWCIQDNIQDRGRTISATTLIGCPLRSYLIATNDIYLPLEDLWWAAMRGAMVHKMLEAYPDEDYVTEARHTREIEGIKVTGQIDAYCKPEQALYDYKTTKWIKEKYLPSEEHELQVNIYRWLLEKEPVNSMWIVYMDMNRHVVLPAEPMEVEDLIAKQAAKLDKAFSTNTPPESEVGWICNGANKAGKIYCAAYDICPAHEKREQLQMRKVVKK